jgi:hypothetical protein
MTDCIYQGACDASDEKAGAHATKPRTGTVIAWIGVMDHVRAVVRDDVTRQCVTVAVEDITLPPFASSLTEARMNQIEAQLRSDVALGEERRLGAARSDADTRLRIRDGILRLRNTGMLFTDEGADWLYRHVVLGQDTDPPVPF